MTEIIRTNICVTTYLTPTGAIADKEGIASLREAFDKCMAAGAKKFVLVMERVPHLTGEVLELLLDMQLQHCREHRKASQLKPYLLYGARPLATHLSGGSACQINNPGHS